MQEDTQQRLIGDAFSGSIYDFDEVIIRHNGEVKADGLFATSNFAVNDWPDSLLTGTLLSLEYHIELPHNRMPGVIHRDTLLVEYELEEPDCRVIQEEHKWMNFIRVSYNGQIHFESELDNILGCVPIWLDRIN